MVFVREREGGGGKERALSVGERLLIRCGCLIVRNFPPVKCLSVKCRTSFGVAISS